MHKWSKEILECVKAKVEAIGIDNFEGQNLDDLKDWTEIAKNIVCFDKDYHIVEAMKKAEENEEIMEMLEQYEDYPERRYYDNYRYKTSGRYAPKGKGSYVGRRGYEEPPYWHMMPQGYQMSPNDYKSHSPEYWRDMDKGAGKMYYTEPMRNDGNYPHDLKDGRSWKTRRGYMESKELHKANTPEDKQTKMRNLEEYAKELTEDIVEMISDMTAEEKNLLRTKMQTLTQKIV